MDIVIVGGGTAAWLSAAYLQKKHPRYTITVIDKTEGTPIGVGEATILDFAPFMQECGYEIHHWMPKVNGTFKSGILFPDWGFDGNKIWHPFRTHITYNVYGQWDIWSLDKTKPFEQYGVCAYDVSQQNKVDFNRLGDYAYHVDCVKLVEFLQNSTQVNLIKSDVVSINKSDSSIESVVLDNGRTVTGDLFIDCTGFKSLLKTQDRVNLDDRLFCNTAVVGQIQYQDKTAEMRPYAVSRAVDHGWIWEIPVTDRIGSGLVFNRDVTSIDEAKDYFVKYWDGRVTTDSVRVIDWTPFYIKNFWQGNVVSIGLSCGFIEPLESTGISMMIKGIKQLSSKITVGVYTDIDVQLYNAQMTSVFEDAVNFVNMHYSNSKRESKFWNFVKSKFKKTDTLTFYEDYLIDKYKPFAMSTNYVLDNKVFHPTNWMLWLIQLRYPVSKQIDWGLQHVAELNKHFRSSEEQRTLASIPHEDALQLVRLAGGL